MSNKKVRFQLPSSREYFCEMSSNETGYELTFYKANTRLKAVKITEAQLDREFLRKLAVNVGIEFYALTGPYDCADAILRQWHQNFKKKGFLQRLFKA